MDDGEVREIMVEAIPGLMLAACPSFESAWAESVEINRDDTSPGGRLNYLDAADLIRHLVALKVKGDIEELPAVFEVIEALVVSGDDYVRTLGVVGYVEGLQMMSVTSAGLEPERDFRPYLGPASELAWQSLNRSWGRMSMDP